MVAVRRTCALGDQNASHVRSVISIPARSDRVGFFFFSCGRVSSPFACPWEQVLLKLRLNPMDLKAFKDRKPVCFIFSLTIF